MPTTAGESRIARSPGDEQGAAVPHPETAGAWRRIAAIAAFGLVVGVVLFAISSAYPNRGFLGPLCRQNTNEAGFDPWTGLPHGSTYVCRPIGPSDPPAHLVSDPMPDDLAGRRAIPMPVGFGVGVIAAVFFLALRDRRRSRPVRRPTT